MQTRNEKLRAFQRRLTQSMEKVLTHNIVQDFGISTGCEADGYGGGTLQHPADSFLVGVETWGGPANKNRVPVRCCLPDGSGFVFRKYDVPDTYVEYKKALKEMEYDWGLDSASKLPRRSATYLREMYEVVRYIDIDTAIYALEEEYNIEFEHDCQSFDAIVKFDDIICNNCPRYDPSHLGATYAEIEERIKDICGRESNRNYEYYFDLSTDCTRLEFSMLQKYNCVDYNAAYFVAKKLESYFGVELLEEENDDDGDMELIYSALIPFTGEQRESYEAR